MLPQKSDRETLSLLRCAVFRILRAVSKILRVMSRILHAKSAQLLGNKPSVICIPCAKPESVNIVMAFRVD